MKASGLWLMWTFEVTLQGLPVMSKVHHLVGCCKMEPGTNWPMTQMPTASIIRAMLQFLPNCMAQHPRRHLSSSEVTFIRRWKATFTRPSCYSDRPEQQYNDAQTAFSSRSSQKLTVSQLVSTFPIFYSNWRLLLTPRWRSLFHNNKGSLMHIKILYCGVCRHGYNGYMKCIERNYGDHWPGEAKNITEGYTAYQSRNFQIRATTLSCSHFTL
jgi:hypothetical protein